jgi:site-specific recombinase
VNLDRELKRYVRQIRPGLIGATSNPNANLNQLIEEIKVARHLRSELVPKLQDFLLTRDYVSALTETGLTLESGVFGEIFRRLEYKLLPKPVENANILSFLSRVFDAQADADWLERIDREKFAEFLALIMPEKEQLIEALAPQFFMSLEILSLRLAGLGYDPIVTERMHARREYQHAFMDVTRHVHSMLDGKGEAAVPLIRESLDRCAQGVRWVRSKRGTEGISLALTYRLMKIQQVIRRMNLMLDMIESILGEWRNGPAIDLFFEIMAAELRRFNLSRFIGQNVELLAFQITEHTGKTGEHYITRTRSEWRGMFRSASLGGGIVGFMVILKILASHLHLPPAPEGFLNGLIYAIGFLVIHSLGGTLATKQPAMTASTLASSMDDAKNSHQALESLAEVIIRTIRSQMIALLGNFLIALPVAALIALPFALKFHPIMGDEKAWAMLRALHPVKSLSFLYAAMAGVGLFASGLIAGFADNWFVFNHVGSRLKHSEVLRRFVSSANLDHTIHLIDHNIGFWVGNIALGFYLAAMPSMGIIFGLPLDVRHITFSSGQLGASLATLRFQVPTSLVLWTMFSVLCMGLINLGVSFSLSLFVAIKSRRIRFAQTPELLGLLGRRFRRRPIDFFYPPREVG